MCVRGLHANRGNSILISWLTDRLTGCSSGRNKIPPVRDSRSSTILNHLINRVYQNTIEMRFANNCRRREREREKETMARRNENGVSFRGPEIIDSRIFKVWKTNFTSLFLSTTNTERERDLKLVNNLGKFSGETGGITNWTNKLSCSQNWAELNRTKGAGIFRILIPFDWYVHSLILNLIEG